MSGKIAEWQPAIIEVLECDCKALEISNTGEVFWRVGPGQESDVLVGFTCGVRLMMIVQGKDKRVEAMLNVFCFPEVIYFSPPPSLLGYTKLWCLNIPSTHLSSFYPFPVPHSPFPFTLYYFSLSLHAIFLRLLLFFLLLLFQFLIPVPSPWSLFYFSFPLLWVLFIYLLLLSVCILHILFLKLPDPSDLYPLTFNFLFLKKINSFFPFLSSSF